MAKAKVVMVTGASSGLGREFCVDLAKSGHIIIAAARRSDRLESLCNEIKGFGSCSGSGPGSVRAVAVEMDVCWKSAEIEAAVKKAWDAFGRIDALINNAGIRGGVYSPLHWSEKDWDDVVRTNLTGSWLVSKHVCIRMRDAKIKGSVINISSIGGLDRGVPRGGAAYVASKTALHSLTQVMALELGTYNIRVNAIAPGLFKSEITERLMEKYWLKAVASKISPLKTFGTSDPALTSLVHYLLDDSSQYVSGNIFIADAGISLPSVPIFSSL